MKRRWNFKYGFLFYLYCLKVKKRIHEVKQKILARIEEEKEKRSVSWWYKISFGSQSFELFESLEGNQRPVLKEIRSRKSWWRRSSRIFRYFNLFSHMLHGNIFRFQSQIFTFDLKTSTRIAIVPFVPASHCSRSIFRCLEMVTSKISNCDWRRNYLNWKTFPVTARPKKSFSVTGTTRVISRPRPDRGNLEFFILGYRPSYHFCTNWGLRHTSV